MKKKISKWTVEATPLYSGEYELALLQALVKLGGSSESLDVYPVVEELMKPKLIKKRGKYDSNTVRNVTRLAIVRLKQKRQIYPSERGIIWQISESGRERLRIFKESGKDPDKRGSRRLSDWVIGSF